MSARRAYLVTLAVSSALLVAAAWGLDAHRSPGEGPPPSTAESTEGRAEALAPPAASPLPVAAPAAKERNESADPPIEPLEEWMERDPRAALAALRRDDAAHPLSPLRPARRFLAVRALVHLEEIGAARSEAYSFYTDYPDHLLGDAMEALTGMHRGRVAENRAPPFP